MIAAVVRRFVRKHGFALTLVGVVLGLVFLPLLAGRIVSPNDVYLHYDPWASLAEGRAQNPLIHDPPLSYYTLAALWKQGGSFHWNPYVGGGIPGVGSVASAMMSPFALIPTMLLPLPLFYSGMIVLKVLVSFWFSYLWLREERLGKRGAAVGATVIAASGPAVVWWLWQGTNATALYPALMYACARMVNGKMNRFALLALLAISFLLSGFPATIAYGAWVAIAYVLWGLVANLRLPLSEIRKALLAAAAALLIAAPVLDPFVGFLTRTGYLEARADASASIFFPWIHLRSFVQPYWLGDPVMRSWIGDSTLGSMNNFVEATVYLGLLTLPLAFLGLLLRRARARWFFAGLAVFLIALMFGSGSVAAPFANLPGLKFSPMVRLRVVVPVAAGFLAGAGFVVFERFFGRTDRQVLLKRVRFLVALALAADLGLFAAWFTPQIPWRQAVPPESDTIAFLRGEKGPFRVAPTFPYLMPNSAQLAGVEDIRAHWGAEQSWRELLRRIDPGSLEGSTVSTFNSLRMRLDDPLLAMLNVRFVIEPPKIDIIRYLIQDRTEWIVPPEKPLAVGARETVEIQISPGIKCEAFAIPFSFQGRAGRDVFLRVTAASAEGETLWSRTFDAREASRLGVLHVPRVPPATGEMSVAIASDEAWTLMSSEASAAPSWGCVRFPLVLSRSFRDGRVFENLRVLPRFYPSWVSVAMTAEEFVEDGEFDPHEHTAFHGTIPIDVAKLADIPPENRLAKVEIGDLKNGSRTIRTDSPAPFLLVSSEKVTPELEVTLDEERVRLFTVNGMFAAALVPPGSHEVVFVRRIGRGWWPWSAAGVLMFIVLAARDRRSRVAQPG